MVLHGGSLQRPNHLTETDLSHTPPGSVPFDGLVLRVPQKRVGCHGIVDENVEQALRESDLQDRLFLAPAMGPPSPPVISPTYLPRSAA
jgi:hypothetical protein